MEENRKATHLGGMGITITDFVIKIAIVVDHYTVANAEANYVNAVATKDKSVAAKTLHDPIHFVLVEHSKILKGTI